MGQSSSRVVLKAIAVKRDRQQPQPPPAPAQGEAEAEAQRQRHRHVRTVRNQRLKIQRELGAAQQTAASARGIVGPATVSVLWVRSRWPTGAPIELWVGCFGDTHRPSGTRPGFITFRQFLQVAAERARALGTCVDAFIEMSFDRSVGPPGARQRRDLSCPRGVTSAYAAGCALSQAAWSLAGAVAPPHAVAAAQTLPNPLGTPGARVHWFDSRPESSTHGMPSGLQKTIYYGPQVDTPSDDVRGRWMRALIGLTEDYAVSVDPQVPADLIDLLATVVGAAGAEWWRRSFQATVARVLKRARKVDPHDLGWLARIVVETQPHKSLSSVLANAADFYLLLRMLVPYAAGAACVAGAPRHCVVYAGTFHTEHVLRVMHAINSAPGGRGDAAQWRRDVTLGRALYEKTSVEVPIGLLLDRIGLGRADGARYVDPPERTDATAHAVRVLRARVDSTQERSMLADLERTADTQQAARQLIDQLVERSITWTDAAWSVWLVLVRAQVSDAAFEHPTAGPGGQIEWVSLGASLVLMLDSVVRGAQPHRSGVALMTGELPVEALGLRAQGAWNETEVEALTAVMRRVALTVPAFVRCLLRRR